MAEGDVEVAATEIAAALLGAFTTDAVRNSNVANELFAIARALERMAAALEKAGAERK